MLRSTDFDDGTLPLLQQRPVRAAIMGLEQPVAFMRNGGLTAVQTLTAVAEAVRRVYGLDEQAIASCFRNYLSEAQETGREG